MHPRCTPSLLAGTLMMASGSVLAASARPPALGITRIAPIITVTIAASPEASSDVDTRIARAAWLPGDLDTPARRARAALIAGVLDDPSLNGKSADPLDRAQAALLRGAFDEAIMLLDDHESLAASYRGRVIIAYALEFMGQLSDADRVLDPVLAATHAAEDAPRSTAELVEAVRARRLRARLRSDSVPSFQSHQEFIAQQGRSNDPAAPSHWAMRVESAILLAAHEDLQAAELLSQQAVEAAPNAAMPLYQLGLVKHRNNDNNSVLLIAEQLDRVAATIDPSVKTTSVYAAILRARVSIARYDPADALALLKSWEQRFPDMPELLALHCAALAVNPDTSTRELEDMLTTYDQLTSGFPDAMFEVGSALADAGKHEAAAEYLIRAHRVRPKWALPLSRLSRMELNAGRDIVARDVLAQAAQLDPANPLVRTAQAFAEASLDFQTLDTPHFRIRYQLGPDAVFARELVPALERLHSNAAAANQSVPKTKIIIELLPDESWFALRTNTPIHARTPMVAGEARITVLPPRHAAGLSIGPYNWQPILKRTYTHMIQQQPGTPSGQASAASEPFDLESPEYSGVWAERRQAASLAILSADPAQAQPHLEWLADRALTTPQPALELARLHVSYRDWAAAAVAINRAISIAPYDASLRELAAAIAIEQHDTAEAERHILALIDLEPQRPRHRQRLEALRHAPSR